jgi:hypothetical protein
LNLEEAIQLVQWLDEEHRRDKSETAEIKGQLTELYTRLAGLGKSLGDLEERLARVHGQTLRYPQIEQAVAQVKADVQGMLDQYEKTRLQSEEDAYKVHVLERERDEQIHSSLQMQIEALQQFQRGIVGDHDVLTRLDLVLVTLQRELEEGIRRDEGYDQRIKLLEEWVPRFGQLATEQRQLSERLRTERSDAVESARRAEQQRARHMAEWAEQMKASRREVEEWLSTMRSIKEQMKEDRKIYPELQELEDRLKPLEPRLLQWQRIVEESRHKERDTLTQDMEKRWQQQMGEWQFVREELNKRLSAITDRVSKLEDWRPEIVAGLHEFVDRIDKERRERIAMVVEIVKAIAEVEHERSQFSLTKHFDELLARVEGEKAALIRQRKAQQRIPEGE